MFVGGQDLSSLFSESSNQAVDYNWFHSEISTPLGLSLFSSALKIFETLIMVYPIFSEPELYILFINSCFLTEQGSPDNSF